MKLFTGSLAAGLVLLAAGAQAQVPYGNGRRHTRRRRTLTRPTAAVPREIPGPRYGYGPSLLPSTEVYAVLRDNGFSPLGIPRLRGFVYTIAVIDRGGEDGRLIIDARNGRIIRFMPAYRMGEQFNEESRVITVLRGAPPPTMSVAAPRPPRSGPQVASRTVPVPKANPLAAKPAAPNRSSKRRRPRQSRQRFRPRLRRPSTTGPRRRSPLRRSRRLRTCRSRRGWSKTASLRRCTSKNAPVCRGVFHCGPAIPADPRRPGSGRRPPRASRPATGGRLPARSWSRSCAWRETVRGRG